MRITKKNNPHVWGSPAWRYRQVVYREALINCLILLKGNMCAICGAVAPAYKYEIDHIVPFAVEQNNSVENLRLLCHDCHAARSAQQRKDKIPWV